MPEDSDMSRGTRGTIKTDNVLFRRGRRIRIPGHHDNLWQTCDITCVTLLRHLTASGYPRRWAGFWPRCSQVTGCNLLSERVARHWSPSLSIRIILL